MSNEIPKDIAAELRVRAAIEQIPGTLFDRAAAEIERLRAERDEARQVMAGTDHRMSRLLSEISCRIEHGAESNGHLEAIWNLWLEGRL